MVRARRSSHTLRKYDAGRAEYDSIGLRLPISVAYWNARTNPTGSAGEMA